MTGAPFEVGERVNANQLISWSYAGLSGKPGKDLNAVRRFKKGAWILEVFAHEKATRESRVVSIRTSDEDASHWLETRERRMRHRDR